MTSVDLGVLGPGKKLLGGEGIEGAGQLRDGGVPLNRASWGSVRKEPRNGLCESPPAGGLHEMAAKPKGSQTSGDFQWSTCLGFSWSVLELSWHQAAVLWPVCGDAKREVLREWLSCRKKQRCSFELFLFHLTVKMPRGSQMIH